jgi:hypothetical protein
VLSGLQITASDSPFGVFKLFLLFFFWLLCCQAFKLRLLIALFGIFKAIRRRNMKAKQHNNQKKKDKKSLKTQKG